MCRSKVQNKKWIAPFATKRTEEFMVGLNCMQPSATLCILHYLQMIVHIEYRATCICRTGTVYMYMYILCNDIYMYMYMYMQLGLGV